MRTVRPYQSNQDHRSCQAATEHTPGPEPPPEHESPELNALFLRLHRQIYRVAICVMGIPEDAEDAVQDAFLRLRRHVSKNGGWAIFAAPDDPDDGSVLTPSSRASTRVRVWLTRVAFRMALNRQRDQAWRLGRLQERALPDEVDPAPSSIERLEIGERCWRVRRLLERLPRRQVLLLVLRYSLGYSYEEIATVTGAAPGSIGHILARAKRTLTAMDKGEGKGDTVARAGERRGRAETPVAPESGERPWT
jgi:RNA polymerase sigma-70 factor, ECF subfamily